MIKRVSIEFSGDKILQIIICLHLIFILLFSSLKIPQSFWIFLIISHLSMAITNPIFASCGGNLKERKTKELLKREKNKRTSSIDISYVK